MTQLTIESTPLGAQVVIDGDAKGTTPLTVPIGEDIELYEFRSECMSDGSVACAWRTLQHRLDDLTVSNLWWDMTRDERYSIAIAAIQNNPYGLATNLKNFSGESNCVGPIGRGTQGNCATSAAIRYTKFGGQAPIIDYIGPDCTNNVDGVYFQLDKSDVIQCLRQPNPYRLPCHFVQCLNEAKGRWHVMSAIQIVDSLDDLNNWVVFQYNSVDIKPGHIQMSRDCKVVIFTLSVIGRYGTDSRMEKATTIAEFEI